MSPAASAAIATGFLKDLIDAGHLPQDLSYLACDANKLARARKMSMKKSKEKDKSKLKDCDVIGIYFDGRKDQTRFLIPDENGHFHPRLIKEEHITVTVEPSGDYLGHVTPETPIYSEKPAKKIAGAVFDLISEKRIS